MACYTFNDFPEETNPEQIKINKLFVDKDNKVEYSKILTRNPIRQPGVYDDLINLQKKKY